MACILVAWPGIKFYPEQACGTTACIVSTNEGASAADLRKNKKKQISETKNLSPFNAFELLQKS